MIEKGSGRFFFIFIFMFAFFIIALARSLTMMAFSFVLPMIFCKSINTYMRERATEHTRAMKTEENFAILILVYIAMKAHDEKPRSMMTRFIFF